MSGGARTSSPSSLPRPAWAALWAAAAVALAALLIRSWRIDYPYSIDFQTYWLAGSRVASGRAAAIYAAGGGPAEGTPRALGAHEFKNLPIVSLAFAPLSRLEYPAAKRLFWWIDLAALAGTAALLGVTVLPATLGGKLDRGLLAIAVVGLLAPSQTALRHAQTTPLVTLALAGSLAAALAGRPFLSGLLLGAAGLVKIPVLALGALDLLRGRLRALAGFATIIAGAVGLSFALFGAALHGEYVEGLLGNAGTVIVGHNDQSIGAVAARLAGPVDVNDWTPRPLRGAAAAATAIVTVGLAGLLGVGLFAGRRVEGARGGRFFLEYAAVLAFAIVALPVAWDHYFLMLVPAFAALVAGLDARGLLPLPFFAGAPAGDVPETRAGSSVSREAAPPAGLFAPDVGVAAPRAGAAGADAGDAAATSSSSRPGRPSTRRRLLVAGSLVAALLLIALPTPEWLLARAASIGWPAGLALSHYCAGALLVLTLAVTGLRARTPDRRDDPRPAILVEAR